MKVCIFGAGAIGGYMGGCLARAGIDVSLVARGPHLQAMQNNGLTIEDGTGHQTLNMRVTDDPAILGVQNYVIVSVKAISLSGVDIDPLLGPDTAVVTAMNGIPWWYYYGLPADEKVSPLESVDPGGDFWNRVGPQRAIGATIDYAAEVRAPGHVRCVNGNRFTIGEPTGEVSDRCLWLAEFLNRAGLDVRVSSTIRNDVWNKIWGNAVFNPLSALTTATLGTLANDKDMRRLATLMMREICDVGSAVGCEFEGSIENRINLAARHGNHRSSMLQDLEAGRPMELDPILGAVCELGRRCGVRTPSLDMVHAVLRIRARQGYS
jgi:2-dehydropantoate 2-reductase